MNLSEFDTILLAEFRLGLPPLFFQKLLEHQDDWAFVLKIHALFEGTLTRLLMERAKRNPRIKFDERDTFYSRLMLADDNGLLEPDNKRFLEELSRLRNKTIHNLDFITLNLRKYVDGLNDREFHRQAKNLAVGWKENPEDLPVLQTALKFPFQPTKRTLKTLREFFFQNTPKMAIWYSGLWTLDLLSLKFHYERVGDEWVLEAGAEAKLQDLHHDPEVIRYQRKIMEEFNGGNSQL